MTYLKPLLLISDDRNLMHRNQPQAVLIATLVLFFSATASSQGQNQTCRGVLTSSGTIASLNYPNNYPVNVSCAWTLISNSSHTNVRLQFLYFDTELDYDFVQVYDEYNHQYSYTGSRLPPTITLGRWATVEFKVSGVGRNRRGFSANFTSIENNSSCGGFLIGSGSITSPNFPTVYPNNLTCAWTLQSSSNTNNIRLQFAAFFTEKCCDYLHVYDEKGRIFRYSGSVRPLPMTLGRWATLLFVSDKTLTEFGFSASFTSVNSTDASQCTTSDTYWCRNSEKCISSNWRCDGVLDCLHGEDETWCRTLTTTSPESQCTADGRYWCSITRRCISQTWRCDGDRDCSYGEDESGCFNSPSIGCQQRGSYWCSRSRKCIASSWKCDHSSDCFYGEDEEGCSYWSQGTIGAVTAGSVCGIVLLLIFLVAVRRFMNRQRINQRSRSSRLQVHSARNTSPTIWSTPSNYADQFSSSHPKPGISGLPEYEAAPPSYEASMNAYSGCQSPDFQAQSEAPALLSTHAAADLIRNPAP